MTLLDATVQLLLPLSTGDHFSPAMTLVLRAVSSPNKLSKIILVLRTQPKSIGMPSVPTWYQPFWEGRLLGLSAAHRFRVSYHQMVILGDLLNSRYSLAALGRKWTLLLFTFVFCIGGILQTIAGEGRGLGYIYSGRIIAGIGVGAICAVSPAYLSECAPRGIRGRVTGLFDIFAAAGVTLSYFVDCTYVQYTV